MLELVLDLWVLALVVTASLFTGVVVLQAATRRVRAVLHRERRAVVTVLTPGSVERRRVAA